MNKDNLKLTELYKLIQEGFEPSNEDDLIEGPAKELLDLFINAMDNRFPSTLKKYPEEHAIWKKEITKRLASIIQIVRIHYHNGNYGNIEFSYTLASAWYDIIARVFTLIQRLKQEVSYHRELMVVIALGHSIDSLPQPEELDRYLS